jgi:hypothetical protein
MFSVCFTNIVSSVDEEEEAEGNNAPAVDASGQYAFTSDRTSMPLPPTIASNSVSSSRRTPRRFLFRPAVESADISAVTPFGLHLQPQPSLSTKVVLPSLSPSLFRPLTTVAVDHTKKALLGLVSISIRDPQGMSRHHPTLPLAVGHSGQARHQRAVRALLRL